ncbi:acyl-CoA dehydrogenase [Nocardiopsis changdeensis]|uniref:Acyl-CoA dehydrogenase n=1 Tax=Nocardiopsis changdeensis TaxID=2831969 RepID=A0ABX8BLK0_9ACTN|nr:MULTISPECIES: acyl-CoA dehydrogenase [Nocardiopsis]QUX23119.1 acyl-CoA dehydrogenase [Nocardiopsis changdeensis]QYX39064.1 acyl-CoA dehydrogenase [Nocardiopsis sp. MT53]
MTHYKSNLRDIQFNLFELFNRQDILGQGPFEELDEETARTILDEVNRLATGVVAESFEDADRNPPVFDPKTNTVRIPESLKKSYQAYMDAGWYNLDLPQELDGLGAPRSLVWAAAELILGANPSIHMYSAGPGFASILYSEGNEKQKEFARLAIERGWGATMVLTEPDAGSDVGAGRTKATDQGDGTWHIEGVKRFITSAEQDMTENIFHLVLARPEGAGPGTKGLSLFLVPKYLVNEDGSLGERNGAYVTNVEHKMGLKASTTCELTFGDKHPAIGYLVGDKHDGIRQMFLIIEYARMMVGTKAIATLSTGYLNALEYAKERVQGNDLAGAKDSPKVTITHHPDVRRSLMTQKSYVEAMRALVTLTATQQDAIQIAKAKGEDHSALEAMNDLLLPIVKGVGSERSYALLAESLQTLGGSGFLQEYPIEQYIRDAKIDTLYEGTTAIQAQDFFFRKILKNGGQALGTLAGEIKAFANSEAGNGQLKEERKLLLEATENVEKIVEVMVGHAMGSAENPRELYKVGLNSVRLLMAFGDVVLGWLLLRQAEVALNRIDGAQGDDKDFYTGKIAAARFFADQFLPRIAAERRIAENVTNDLMEVPESAF